MNTLNNAQKRRLKALGQRLEASIRVGKSGFTDTFLANLDQALALNELVKVRFDHFKEEKKTLAVELATRTNSELIQRVGHTALLFRQGPG